MNLQRCKDHCGYMRKHFCKKYNQKLHPAFRIYLRRCEACKKDNQTNVRIWHSYEFGESVFLAREKNGINPIRAALYCEFKCEEWYGEEATLLVAGIATMLVRFYGFCCASPTGFDFDLNMHT